ncbi:MAG: META domain-containing protein [Tannerellaceae bacterium]|nr:META domain-containing protein [Tannerellaceae bacterium]
MKHLVRIAFIFILGVICMACGTMKRSSNNLPFSSLNGEWLVQEMNGNRIDAGEQTPYLNFDMEQGTVSGYAGCNRLSGKVEYSQLQNNILKFMQMVTTRMACMDMSIEDEFLKTIDKVVRFDSPDTSAPVRTIDLYGIDGSKILVLQKK